MMAFVGIDVGSTYTKAAVLDGDGRLLGRGIRSTGFKLNDAAERNDDRGTRGGAPRCGRRRLPGEHGLRPEPGAAA